MSRHNYINPAFCQQSEFYPTSNTSQKSLTYQQQQQQQKQQKQQPPLCLDTSSFSINGLFGNEGGGVRRIQRSVSTRSIKSIKNNSNNNGTRNNVTQRNNALNRSQHHFEERAPKPGPKPFLNRTIGTFNTTKETTTSTTTCSGSGRYALVPIEDLSKTASQNGRYTIVPGPTSLQHNQPETNPAFQQRIQTQQIQRFTKSQDNLDCYSHIPVKDNPESSYHDEIDDTFTSLPPIPFNHGDIDQPKMKSAFSSDFGSNSFVLVDQKSNQRYAVVPTADNEDIVDDNHEIIQMHNGRAHRYAVIPTEDEDDLHESYDEDEEEETCLSGSDFNQSYSVIQESNHKSPPIQTSTPQKMSKQNLHVKQMQLQQQQNSYPSTPIKNPDATRKLQELLSTPRKLPSASKLRQTPKPKSIHHNNTTTPTNNASNLTTPRHYHSQQQIYVSQQSMRHEINPQRLQYETKQTSAATAAAAAAYLEARTTAVITPRVANQLDNDDSSFNNKSWLDDTYPQKVANATATLGVISFMLIIGSLLNSGLSLYLIANSGRSFYLEFSLAAAFAGVGLGILGFRSRHCEWLPNRSYISGYILVTVFCLLKCCGLLVLLVLDPFPGMPFHDVTTGIILGLSTFTMFFIGLGVLGSRWCYRPPQDNRVNVY